jgi:hypothetical protein
MIKSRLAVFLTGINFFLLTLFFTPVNIFAADFNIPQFPSCPMPGIGDKAHYDTGLHQIVGGSLMLGRDDVYTLDQGNYLQCFCNPVSGQGIQTNWLRSETDIPGWFHENGAQWNLGNYRYSALNINYNCGEPTPTPTENPEATPTPTGIIPTSPPKTSDGGGTGGGSGQPFICGDEKPAVPVLLSLVQKGKSMKLTWSKVTNATNYALVYGFNPGNYIYGVINTGNVTEYTINDLDPNQKYYAAVSAVNGCSQGNLSNELPTGDVLGIGGAEILGADVLAATGTANQTLAEVCILLGLIILSISIYAQKTQLYPKKTRRS